MAKEALEEPPSASSSDVEEISSEEEDDDEQISPKDPVTVNATGKKLDFDSDSDSEDEPEVPLNRRSGKAIGVTPAKRRSEGTSRNVTAKRAKTGSKTWWRFSWSEDDGTTLLQGMLDFHAVTGTNPYDDRNGFFDFVKKEISCESSQRRAFEKIRSLRRKYIGEGRKRVNPSSFSKTHDKECMRLAKCIWRSDGMVLLTSVKSKNGKTKANEKKKKKKVESVEPVEQEEDEVLALVGESSGKKVDEDNEVLAHGGVDSGKLVVEEDNEILAHNGVDKAVEEGEKGVLTNGGESLGKKAVEEGDITNGGGDLGEKAVEEGDKEGLTNGGGNLGKKAVEEGDITNGGGNLGKKAVEEGDITNGGGNLGKKAVEEGDITNGGGNLGKKAVEEGDITNGGGNLGTKAVEEGDREGLTHGGGQQSESLCVGEVDWFEKSVLVQSMVRFGVEEHYVKERWRSFPAETKKKLEDGWNSLVSKDFEVVSLKSKFMSDMASMFGQAAI